MLRYRVVTGCTVIAVLLLAGLRQTEASPAHDFASDPKDSFFVYLPLAAKAFSCATVTQIPTQECDSLVSFYLSTQGDQWVNRTNWLVTDQPCQWFGVTCGTPDGNLHVTELYFSSNNLDGPLPRDIYRLSFLTDIQLMVSPLSGPLPVEFALMPNLKNIRLYDDELSGPIPVEISQLTNLHELGLGANQLTGPIPPELGNMTGLASLQLQHNLLTGSVPASLGNLPNLEAIFIYSNPLLSGPLPASLTQLDLISFYFDDTPVCEPTDSAFQNWLTSIPNLQRNYIPCP